MSLANWSDIIEICDDSYTAGSFHALKRRKVSWTQLAKWQKSADGREQDKPDYAVMVMEK